MKLTLKKTGSTWSIVDKNGRVLYGGYFNRDVARMMLDDLRFRIRDEKLAPKRP